MALADLTMDNLIKEKVSYVVPTVGKSFDKKEDAEKLVLDTCNIGQYYKFYEVFYSPSTENRNKRYTKFMMIMTRRTVAIKGEALQYLTEYVGLSPVIPCGDFGLRDNFIINENADLNTSSKVYNQIVKDMKVNGGMLPGGNEVEVNKVGTLHLIDANGLPLYVGTPKDAKEIFDIFVNFDESKIEVPEEPEKKPGSSLDSMYV